MGKKGDILKKVESSIDRFLKRMGDSIPEYLYGERFQKNVGVLYKTLLSVEEREVTGIKNGAFFKAEVR